MLQLSEKKLKKKYPFSLSHHTLAQQLYFPAVPMLGEHVAAEPDLRSETLFCEKPGCSPHCQLSVKLISFFCFSCFISPTFFSNTQSCKMCIFVLLQAISHLGHEGMNTKGWVWGWFLEKCLTHTSPGTQLHVQFP